MEFEEKPRQQMLRLFLPIVFSLLLIIGIFIGYFLSFKNSSATINKQTTKGNDKLTNLLDYIEYRYVDTVNREQLVEKTLGTVLHNLDPHSDYIPASDFAAVNEPLKGNFDGIGVEFNIISDTIRVINPIIGGPSEKLGIKSGDKIIKVDGKSVAGIKITDKQVFERLRGEKGTQVMVSVLRSGIKQPIDFKITRDAIPIYSIDAAYIVKPGVGYIKINRFAATTYNEYLEAFNKLSKQGMKKMIIDLRGNSGGYLQAAVNIADEFLRNGLLIVYTQGKSSPKEVYKSTERGGFENNELVVLIDEGSASASEIVAGAVQDNDRGTVIGRRSFGKGLVQDQMDLPDGSAIRLTIARYYTPTGRCIQKPYTDKLEDYYNEEYARYEHGELLNIDSIKLDKTLKYTTPGGKTVYGGGGIMPDIFVPIDTGKYSSFVNRAFYAGMVNTFAFEYTNRERKKLEQYKTAQDFVTRFVITKTIANEFYAYCEKQQLKPSTKDIQKSEEVLNMYLKAYIGRLLFDKDAFYPVINSADKCLLEALKVL